MLPYPRLSAPLTASVRSEQTSPRQNQSQTDRLLTTAVIYVCRALVQDADLATALCRLFAADYGWSVVAVESDDLVGARPEQSPGLRAVLGTLRDGRATVVLVPDAAAMSSAEGVVALRRTIEEVGARLQLATECPAIGPKASS